MHASVSATGPIPYTSYDRDQLSLYAWEGERVALLTASANYDEDVMAMVLDGLDRAYDAYILITGREPTPYLTYNGLASIAEVPTAFNGKAAAIGYVGLTGIEITPQLVTQLYTGVRDFGWFDQTLFYELGRNFFFYRAQIDAIAGTGFAIVNRFISMEVAGLNGGPFGTMTFDELKASIVDGLSSAFFSSPNLTLDNTLFSEVAPPNGHDWSWHDFSGSLLYQIYQNFGLSTYADFYRQLEQLPAASDKTSALKNLIDAATAATGLDFSFMAKPEGTSYVAGTAGADILHADGSSNPVQGFGGADELHGSRKADILLAGAGNDQAYGGGGNDQLYGGTGSDFLDGGKGADRMDGGDGDDVLAGGGGHDALTGGEGRDEFTGGPGRDLFVFRNDDFGGSTIDTADRIHDFGRLDRIDLSRVDADLALDGDQEFAFIGMSAFTGTVGELRYQQSGRDILVEGDVDGDGVADFMIRLDATISLGANDFLL